MRRTEKYIFIRKDYNESMYFRLATERNEFAMLTECRKTYSPNECWRDVENETKNCHSRDCGVRHRHRLAHGTAAGQRYDDDFTFSRFYKNIYATRSSRKAVPTYRLVRVAVTMHNFLSTKLFT
jgi:hypothetical protein